MACGICSQRQVIDRKAGIGGGGETERRVKLIEGKESRRQARGPVIDLVRERGR